MTIGQELLKEVESEMSASRRLIERVPDEKVRWKPHPKSAALGHLTQLVCRMPKVMSDIGKGIVLDLAAGPGYSFETTHAHHRGKPTVYMRLLDVPIPQRYGPTADEK